ncbi:helix-turn-helix domain-containing protein [Sulfurovum sp. CS9]|uniref:helix-turn-helix domain-containing protein n=1 Tax=Sulfurovum sp. CS9 TaxID=3391146 RepID=UPI0039EB0A58
MNQESIFKTLYEGYKVFLLNKEQTAKELGVSKATLDRFRKDGSIESKTVGGQIMFKLDEVARYLAS